MQTPSSAKAPLTSGASGRDAIIAGTLALVTILVWAPLIRLGLSLGDEGWQMSGVHRLLAGETLYVDFQRSYAPGVYWSRVPLFYLFGENVLVARAASLVELAGVVALAYLLARPYAPRWAAIGCALFPMLLRPVPYKTFVPLSLLAGLWLCRRLVTGQRSARETFLVGVGLGIVGMFRQEVAAYSFLIACLSVLATGWRSRAPQEPPGSMLKVCAGRWVALGAGAALVWAPWVAHFVAHGALDEAFDQLVLMGLRGNDAMDKDFPALERIVNGPARLRTSLYYFPALAVILGALLVAWAAARRRLEVRHLVLAQWTIMGLLAHSIFLQRSGFAHLKQALVVPALLLAYLVALLARPGGTARWLRHLSLVPVAVWTVFVWSTFTPLLDSYEELAQGVRLQEPRAPVVLEPQRARQLEELLAELRERTRPDEPVFVAPHLSMLHFLTQRPHSTRHDSLWPGFASSTKIQEQVLADLERSAVDTIIIKDVRWDDQDERHFPTYTPLIERYLDENFTEQARVKHFAILERRAPAESE